MIPFDFYQGKLPLLVSFPHSGNWLPDKIVQTLTGAGKAVPDTDWFLPRLYDFPVVQNASQLVANFSRYLIDPNRPPDGSNLYPGQPTPLLCPLQTFSGDPIYRENQEPDESEIKRRRQEFWQRYHDQLQSETERLVGEFGVAILFDAHSIKSKVPRLFEGQLPDINIGTANSESCDTSLQADIQNFLNQQSNFSSVINGRFIGGYITRNYGHPEKGVHTVQLELSQITYMDEDEMTWDESKASLVAPVLEGFVEVLARWLESRCK